MIIENMSDAEIENRLAEVTEEIAQIKTQIGAAKAEAAATGNYADRDWFLRANHALRMKGREHQLLQTEHGKRRKAVRRDFNARVERAFIDVARRRLDPELFSEMWSEAMSEGERGGEE